MWYSPSEYQITGSSTFVFGIPSTCHQSPLLWTSHIPSRESAIAISPFRFVASYLPSGLTMMLTFDSENPDPPSAFSLPPFPLSISSHGPSRLFEIWIVPLAISPCMPVSLTEIAYLYPSAYRGSDSLISNANTLCPAPSHQSGQIGPMSSYGPYRLSLTAYTACDPCQPEMPSCPQCPPA